MDLIIPYREDRHTGEELKFALRSIETYLKGYGEILIIGDEPTGIKGCWVIRHKDEPGTKEQNILNKVKRGFHYASKAIMWHDDHYLLKPLNVSELGYYHNGPLKDQIRKAHSGYKNTIQNTLHKFPEALNFDIHTPIIFEKDKFCTLNPRKETCIKSLYCATYEIKGEYMDDLKINGTHTLTELRNVIQDRLFFSTGHLFNPTMDLLKELYPNPSRFEK